MRIPLPLRVINNFWSYYLLKLGFIKKAMLNFRTTPDLLTIEFDEERLRVQWNHIKQLMKLIVASDFEYFIDKNEMVVYSTNKEKRRDAFDFSAIDSLRYALDNHITVEKSADDSLLKATICGGAYQFYTRKTCPSDLSTIKVVCEENEYEFLYPYLFEKTIVDVGANIGDTAVLFAKKGARHIEAFEIHPVLYSMAKQNISLNKVDSKVTLYDFGIGGIDGVMHMRDDSSLGPTAGFGYVQAKFGKDVTVKVVALSSVIRRLGKIDVLKMDCEGAEFDIFQNCSEDDLRKIDVIGLEYHKNPQPLISKFEAAGYRVKIVKQENLSLGLMLATRCS